VEVYHCARLLRACLQVQSSVAARHILWFFLILRTLYN